MTRKWQKDKTSISFSLCLAPSVSRALVKLHFFSTQHDRVCACVSLLISSIFSSCSSPKIVHWQSRNSALMPLHALLTSRLMILSVVRWILGVSVFMWIFRMCEKLCRQVGDKQSSPSPPYSCTSKDRHWRDSSHTSWFSSDSCRDSSVQHEMKCKNKVFF